MIGFVITIHVIICLLLITVTLIQSGRGGGLVEGFSGLESMLGTKTNTFLTRATIVLSIIFFFTCLALAFLSLQQSRSLMQNVKSSQAPVINQTVNIPNKQQALPQTPVSLPVGASQGNATQ